MAGNLTSVGKFLYGSEDTWYNVTYSQLAAKGVGDLTTDAFLINGASVNGSLEYWNGSAWVDAGGANIYLATTAMLGTYDGNPGTTTAAYTANFDGTGTIGTSQIRWKAPADVSGSAVNGFKVTTYSPVDNDFSDTDGDADGIYEQVQFSVGAVNDAPTLTTILPFGALPEDTPQVITYADLAISADEFDAEGSAISFRITALNAGTLEISKGGAAYVAVNLADPTFNLCTVGATDELRWTPAANTSGQTTAFFVKAFDGTLLSSTAIAVTTNVAAMNDVPVADADAFVIAEDATSTNLIATVLAGDTDVENDPLQVISVGFSAAGATITLQDTDFDGINDSLVYQANAFEALGAGEVVTDTFTYTVSDGNSGTDTATVTVTVTGENDTPNGVNSAVTLNVGQPSHVFSLADFGYSDPDSTDQALGPVAVGIASLPVAGLLTLDGVEVQVSDSISAAAINAGLLVFTPAPEAAGANYAGFTFVVNDGHGGFDATPATLAIHVMPPDLPGNDNPFPVADTIAMPVSEDGPGMDISDTAVLANDLDPDASDVLTVLSVASSSAEGASVSHAGGVISYDPAGQFEYLDDGETATDVISYTVTDGNGGTASANITVTVTGVNDAPNAHTDTVTATDTTGTGVLMEVTGNVIADDTDPDLADAGHLSVTSLTNVAPIMFGRTSSSSSSSTTTVAAGDPIMGANGNGVFTVTADGNFNYVVHPRAQSFIDSLDANESTTDYIFYTVSDGDLTSTSVQGVVLKGVNDAATANDDMGNVGTEDTDWVGNVLANDTDVDGEALTAVLVGGPAHGSLTLNADGSFTYTPDADWNGTDTFTYMANDGSVNSNVATASVWIAPVNDAALIGGDTSVTITEDDTGTSGALTISDIDSPETFVAQVATAGSYGTFHVAATGAWSYDLTANMNGMNVSDTTTDTVIVSAADGTTQTLSVNINGVNDAAVIGGTDTSDIGENDPGASGTLSITDVDNTAAFAADSTVTAAHGIFGINASGNWGYTLTDTMDYLATGATATDSFNAVAVDGTQHRVQVTIHGANDAPVADNDAASVNEDAVTGNLLSTLLAGDVDTDVGDTLVVASVGFNPNVSAIDVDADGDMDFVSYDAASYDWLAQGQIMTDTFTYTVSDGHGGIDIATATVTITGVNDAPVAAGDSTSVSEDAVTVNLIPNLLTNDSDTDSGDTLFIKAVGAGAVGVNSDTDVALESVTFDATAYDSLAAGDWTTDTFTYTVSDGHGGTDTASVTVTITGVNDGPVADADTVGVNEDAITGNLLATLLAGDVDTDIGDTLRVVAVGLNPNVVATDANADSVYESVTYDAATYDWLSAGDWTTDTFVYWVSDGHGATDQATMTVTITGVNDAPVAANDTASVNEDAVTGNLVPTLLANDADTDTGDTLFIKAVGAGLVGANTDTDAALEGVTFDASAYDSLAAGDSTIDTFTYTVSDGHGGTDTASIAITIHGMNDAPVADSDSTSVSEDAVTGNLVPTLLAGDSDIDSGDTLFIKAVGVGLVGANTDTDAALEGVTFDAAAYDHLAAGDFTTDTYTYTVSDGLGGTDTASLFITINGVNDAPVADNDTASVDEDTTSPNLAALMLAGDVDTDVGDTLFIKAVGVGLVGVNTDTDAALDTVTFDAAAYDSLAAGDSTIDNFTYTVSDGHGGTDTASIAITIHGMNDAPVADSDSTSVSEDVFSGNLLGTLLAGDSDIDSGDTLFIKAVGAGLVGTNADADAALEGVYFSAASYDWLAQGQATTDTFTYTVSDGLGGTDTGSVMITINGINDAALFGGDVLLNITEDDTFTSGTMTVSDVDGADTFVAEVLTAGNNGIFNLGTDGAWSYELTDNLNFMNTSDPDVVDSITVSAADGTTQTLTVNISGVNDAAVIGGADAASIGENDPGASGLLTITDVDNTATFSSDTAITGAYGEFDITTAGAWTYTLIDDMNYLAAGASVVDSFNAVAADGTTHAVQVTINGANDAAVIGGDVTLNITEDDTGTSGTMTVSDVDGADSFIAQVASAGTYGTFHVGTNGAWSYDLTANLNAMDTSDADVVDSITVSAADGTTQTLTVNIAGVNDAPTLTAFDTSTVTFSTAETQAMIISFAEIAAIGNQADVDGDPLSFRIGSVPVDPVTGGYLEINEGGGYHAAVNGDILDAGDFLKWSPNQAAGDTVAFSLAAWDGDAASAPVDFSIFVAPEDTTTVYDLGTGMGTGDTTLNMTFTTGDLLIITGAPANLIQFSQGADTTLAFNDDGAADNDTDTLVLLNFNGDLDGANVTFADGTVLKTNLNGTLGTTLIGTNVSFVGGNPVGDQLIGSGVADTLKGLAGNDTLRGGEGNDLITGGTQDDNLWGDGGADKFIYSARNGSANDGGDWIHDFVDGVDKIYLSDVTNTQLNKAFANYVTVTDAGVDTLVTFADGNSVTLLGIDDATTITRADFLGYL